MEYYGDVKFDGILKDEWCELQVMGSLRERARVDLAIYHKNGKMGVMHITHEEIDEEAIFFCEEFIPCEYEDISFIKTAEGTFLIVKKEDRQGIIGLAAYEEVDYTHVFYNELFPCIYDEIRYRGGYPAYFLLYEGEAVFKYNFLTKEVTLGL